MQASRERAKFLYLEWEKSREGRLITQTRPSANVPCIVTHHGFFHCDEALAVAMLSMLPQFANRDVFRTRTLELIQPADVVVDVGGVYDASLHRFDHHQQTFQTTLGPSSTIKLSASGLVFLHYGKELIRYLYNESQQLEIELSDADVDALFTHIYDEFMKPIDGHDNGVEATEGKTNYRHHTNLTDRVRQFNIQWNETQTTELENTRFSQAVRLTALEFIQCVCRAIFDWLPVNSVVEKAWNERFNIHPSGTIIELLYYVPYHEYLTLLEQANPDAVKVLFVLHRDATSHWRVTCVNESGFKSRLPLHETWRGVPVEELREKSGIPDATFVHRNGFTGGAISHKGAFELAVRTLNQQVNM